jgi:hypothetical protein
MTIIKNHFEVFTHICQLNVSYGQDSVSGMVPSNDRRNKKEKKEQTKQITANY